MLTITRKDLLLTINDNVIPAMGSSDVLVKFVNDTETYVDFLIEPRVGYYVNGCPKSGICEYDTSSNIIKIPAESFKNKGILVIAIALIDNADSNHIEVTKELALEVTPAPSGTVILPATDTWQTAVNNLVEQLYNQDYKPQFDEIEENLHNLVKEAQNQQNKANNQQTQIDNAIDVMGDYEIVQDNPTQIRFKKGDGTYGNTVNLGDNLASKSMVNAGYDTYSGNSYSGSASDFGIEIGKVSGNYEQVTTNGYQLFDESKLPTKTQGGATVTNNGDGSFTISGSGNLTSAFSHSYTYTKEEALKLIKAGTLYGAAEMVTNPYYIFGIYNKSDGTSVRTVSNNVNKIISATIIEDYISKINDGLYELKIYFYGISGRAITPGTIKPMVYQDGDGTWERFTGGEPAPNFEYPCMPKFFEPRVIYSVSKNMFNFDLIKTTVCKNGTKTYDDNSITLKATANDCYDATYRSSNFRIKVKPNTKYTLLFKRNSTVSGITYIFEFDEDGNVLTPYQAKGGYLLEESVTFTTKPNCNMIAFRVGIATSGKTCTFSDFMILEGELTWETVGGFIPYKGQDTTPLDIILRALPNGVRDTYKNNIITRQIGVVTFDGSDDEKWTNPTVLGNIIRFQLSKQDSTITGYCLCNKLKNIIDYTRETEHIYVMGSVFLFTNISRLSTQDVNGLKAFLKSNPISVWYELAEPTTEQVDLPVIPSYYPFTNAWHDSPLQPQITWNVLTGRSAILDGNGDIIQNGYMTPQDNLLTNSMWLYGVINQKKELNYWKNSSWEYTIDMWMHLYNTIQVGNGYIYIYNETNESGTTYVKQKVDTRFTGVDCTVALNVIEINGNVSINEFGTLKKGLNVFTAKPTTNELQINLVGNSNVKIQYIKLEKGKHFTGFPLWNEVIELLKCMKRYQTGEVKGTNWTNYKDSQFIFSVHIFPMAKKPSVSFTNTDNYGVVNASVSVHDNSTLNVAYTKSGVEGGLRYGMKWVADAYEY